MVLEAKVLSAAPYVAPLAAEQLRRVCEPQRLDFRADGRPLAEVVGQPGAVEALGLELPSCHVVATGPPGTGAADRRRRASPRHAAARPAPADRVYVFRFSTPRDPLAITLPAGRGRALAREVEQLVGEARRQLPVAAPGDRRSPTRDPRARPDPDRPGAATSPGQRTTSPRAAPACRAQARPRAIRESRRCSGQRQPAARRAASRPS